MQATTMRRLRPVSPDPEIDGNAQAGSVRIAFATHDLHTLDAHFAGARNFAIYSVTADGHRFVEAIRFDRMSQEDGQHADAEEDRITPRVDALEGCALLFVLAIGGPAAAKVVNRRIHPVKLPQPEPIEQVLARVRTMLRTAPPPWLRKALAGAAPPTLDFLDDDEARA